MTAVRAIGFDLDGTLFDHRTAGRTGAEQFLTGLGATVTPPVLDAWSAAEDEHFERWRSGEIDFREQRRERLRTVLPPLGLALPHDPGALDGLFERYLDAYRAAWRAFPDSLPLLRELRQRGHRLGLLTNGSAAQQSEKLAVTGLDAAFDVVCISEHIGAQKPDARAFAVLADGLGVPASECLFVGDDPVHDAAGARSAGMTAVLVDRYTSGAPDVRRQVLAALGES
ncbi:HAD family hydrolase [Curtobacterium sp. A7_M15]|uniref:HAD family hydrolase n=1 Tax=Curtobacterium sp. A7_M15 TaxID=3065241 RepID=UPI002737C51E|nr:HAD family hydrolase [Curtobacterium sp. A7_M15]MDP4333673.1 HAD family hydrolase [Curtobacterium sp. A7_M15]